MSDIEDFLNYLAADRGYSLRTLECYREALNSFRIFYQSISEELNWNVIDADIVRRWMAAEMERGRSARTIAKKLSALRSFYKYLLRMEKVDHDPVRLVKNPKIHIPLPTFLKQSEVDRLFDQVEFPETYEGLRDRTILLTFYHTGVRVSELIGLTAVDIHTDERELKVTGKRNKQRIIPYGKELADAFQTYRTERNDLFGEEPAFFLDAKGQPMTKGKVLKIVKHYLSLVTTQKKKSPHVLRHTFATAMLNNGADLEAIKELLGHESISTTEVYTHTTFADLKKEYERAHPRA